MLQVVFDLFNAQDSRKHSQTNAFAKILICLLLGSPKVPHKSILDFSIILFFRIIEIVRIQILDFLVALILFLFLLFLLFSLLFLFFLLHTFLIFHLRLLEYPERLSETRPFGNLDFCLFGCIYSLPLPFFFLLLL